MRKTRPLTSRSSESGWEIDSRLQRHGNSDPGKKSPVEDKVGTEYQAIPLPESPVFRLPSQQLVVAFLTPGSPLNTVRARGGCPVTFPAKVTPGNIASQMGSQREEAPNRVSATETFPFRAEPLSFQEERQKTEAVQTGRQREVMLCIPTPRTGVPSPAPRKVAISCLLKVSCLGGPNLSCTCLLRGPPSGANCAPWSTVLQPVSRGHLSTA